MELRTDLKRSDISQGLEDQTRSPHLMPFIETKERVIVPVPYVDETVNRNVLEYARRSDDGFRKLFNMCVQSAPEIVKEFIRQRHGIQDYRME